MNWMFIWSLIKDFPSLTYLLIRGIYYLITFKIMHVWYSIFTPKEAEYIEDVKLLDKYNKRCIMWTFEATIKLSPYMGLIR